MQQLYTRLSELLGLHDHLLLLNVIVGKMTTNLKYYTKVIIVNIIIFCIAVIINLTAWEFLCAVQGGYWSYLKSLSGNDIWVSLVPSQLPWSDIIHYLCNFIIWLLYILLGKDFVFADTCQENCFLNWILLNTYYRIRMWAASKSIRTRCIFYLCVALLLLCYILFEIILFM